MKTAKMNLRFFDETEEQDFDLDAFKEEFEKEYEEEETTTEEEPPTEEKTDDLPEEETTTEETPPEEEESSSQDQEPEQGKDAKAFAQMRNQLKEKEQYEAFVKQISEHYGAKPEELMQRFNEQKIEQEAKQQGTNPEVLKRLKSLESENQQVKQQAASEKFNQQVSQTLKEYEVKDNDPTVQKAFEYIAQNHVDANNTPTIDFGDAYFLANKDNIIEKQVEAAKQQQLEDKKKRQESSAIPSGDGKAPESDEWSMDKVEKYLKDHDLLD